MAEMKEITIYAETKEEAQELLSAVWDEDENNSVPYKASFWRRVWSFLVASLCFLWAAILLIVMTPFFLFSYVKNFISLMLVMFIFYTVITIICDNSEYLSFIRTDTAAVVIPIILGIVALFVTIGQYRDRF